MAIGRRWAAGVLEGAIGSGCLVSVHAQDPGDGNRALLAGPSFVGGGTFRVAGPSAINGREIRLDAATRGGRARWVGLWTRDMRFIAGLPMTRQRELAAGQVIVIPRGELRLGLEA